MNIQSLRKLEASARQSGIELWSWLALATATTIAVHSPCSMLTLFQHTTVLKPLHEQILVAEFMREIGLRCAAVIGIPRTIDMLSEFRSALPSNVSAGLNTRPTRLANAPTADSMHAQGRVLWHKIHRPYSDLIKNRLAEAHPDLPVFIIEHEYGFLLSDFGGVVSGRASGIRTSLSAIASLRAQGASRSQLAGHIHGLRKAWEDGSWSSVTDPDTEGGFKWLISDHGCSWLLETVDEL
ncbi:hypothetical protein EK21DRAFT_83067, partial [Setomelanomma holmii]